MGVVGREEAKAPQVHTRPTSGPQMVLNTQPGRGDTIPVEGGISGWMVLIGALHMCQCVCHGINSPPRKADPLSLAIAKVLSG